MMIGFHGHDQVDRADEVSSEATFKAVMAEGPYIGANLDIGHWVAGNLGNPVDFIRKHHDRITHIHVKDRKKGANGVDGVNVPFGQGDTPIVECLQLIRDNKWPIDAVIEFEYPVPAGSDRMAEIAKTVDYCRKALGA